jgi:hypothetical protein
MEERGRLTPTTHAQKPEIGPLLLDITWNSTRFEHLHTLESFAQS